MKNHWKHLVWLGLFGLLSCQPVTNQAVLMHINAMQCALLESPKNGSTILDELVLGDSVAYLGEMTDSTTEMYIDSVWCYDPWVKVKTIQGRVGWVNVGQLDPDAAGMAAIDEQLQATRIRGMFGAELGGQILAYRTSYKSAKTSQDVASLYQIGTSLRDTSVWRLQQKIVIEDLNQSPDLLWLERVFPGFVLHLVAEGSAFYLFWDYKQLDALAKTTKGIEDEDFVQLCYRAYSLDSVENFFPSWLIQTADYEGYSLLGQGIHRRLFTEMDTILHKSAIFQQSISRFQRVLLDDITNTTVKYWEPAIKIIGEMEAIVQANYVLFKPKDRVAIATRRKMFDNPEKFGIEVNLRGGQPQD